MSAGTPHSTNLYFFDGWGEMAELCRSVDWSKTSLGDPETWPPGLQSSVSMMLKNPFGMCIAWGSEFIQLYNDSFRPILGQTKHPHALGISSRETFAEIWDVLGPMLSSAMNGESVRTNDLMIRLNRNNVEEKCYFDLACSPIVLNNTTQGGVLITVIETTERRNAINALQDSERKFRTIAEASDILAAVSDHTSNAVYFNQAWSKFTGRSTQELLNFGWADLVHEEDRQGFLDIYLTAFQKRENWRGTFRMLSHDGSYHWLIAKGVAIFHNDNAFNGYVSSSFDVTEQIDLLKKIESSEQDLRSMVLQAPIGICVMDAATLVTEIVNDMFVEIAGKSYEEIFGKYYWEPFKEAAPYYAAALDNVVKTGETFYANEVELMLIRHGKEEIVFVTFVYVPLKDNSGSVSKVAVWVLNNSQQVNARQKIQQSEQDTRALIEAAPFPIGVYKGREMRVEFANEAILTIWGKGPDVIGKKFSDVLPELDNQEVFKQLDQVFLTGVAFHIKNQRLDLVVDGRERPYYFNYSLTPLFDSTGKVYGVMNTGADLTDLVLANQKIERSERNFRNMILQAPVAMCLLSGPNHVVEIANELMLELWGKPTAAVMNKPVWEGLPDAKDQGLEEVMLRVYNTGETFTANEMPVVLLRNGKNDTVYQNFVYDAYRDTDNNIIGVLAITIDVTAQVLARQKIEELVSERTKELADANASLQKSNAELAQFAYIASHDLQEPLRKITTYTQMLESRMSGMLDDQSKSYIAKINNSSTRMNKLIRDVLAYSELGKESEVFVPVDLNEVLENVLSDFDLRIEQKQAKITNNDLPAIEAIPLQMSQLFSNMIGNALKFSRKDLAPVISVTSTKLSGDEAHVMGLNKDNVYYNIRFSDNGIGISPEYEKQIFFIFQRLHRKSEYEGTGIGLAMCKKITLNHHGDINASGSSEQGAVFNVILPSRQDVLHL